MTAKDENDPLVQQALKAGWKVVKDAKGKAYYSNKSLKATTWDLKKDLLSGKYPKPDGAAVPAAASPTR